jgi:hypothetical protein
MEGASRPLICLKRLKKTTKSLSEDSRSLDRHLNLRPPEYEARVLKSVIGPIPSHMNSIHVGRPKESNCESPCNIL